MTYETIQSTVNAMYPLICVHADDGKMLTNGEIVTECIYFSKNNPMNDWHEIDTTSVPDEYINF